VPEVCDAYAAWCEQAAGVYARGAGEDMAREGAGRMQEALGEMLAQLGEEERREVMGEVEEYARALEERGRESGERMKAMFAGGPAQVGEAETATERKRWSISSLGRSTRTSTESARPSTDSTRPSAADAPPGRWLACWQALIDGTPLTSATLRGPVRRGAQAEDDAGVVAGEEVPLGAQGLAGRRWPDMKHTEMLRERFEGVVREVCMRDA
jgi:hypothetical protein